MRSQFFYLAVALLSAAVMGIGALPSMAQREPFPTQPQNEQSLRPLSPQLAQNSRELGTPQTQQEPTTPKPAPEVKDSAIERLLPSIAMVSTRSSGRRSYAGAALVVREDGVLLTSYALVREADSIQVRLRNGEIFDSAEVLGVDERRGIAAIRIPASGLQVPMLASARQAETGEMVSVISNADGVPWSVDSGKVAAYKMADEIQNAGNGYGLLQLSAQLPRGSGGGVVADSQGRVIALIVSFLVTQPNTNFAVPIENVGGLADAPATASIGRPLWMRQNGEQNLGPYVRSARGNESAMHPVKPAVPQVQHLPEAGQGATPEAPEQSDLLKNAKDRDTILRNFHTMYVDARDAKFFGSDDLKAALGKNGDFQKLHIRIVADPKVADTVLKVGYTFAWDYPFQLKHQNTTVVLLAGRGEGPMSGPLGAISVAHEFVKLAEPWRKTPTTETQRHGEQQKH